MSIWEAGYGEQPEEELEQAWHADDPDVWRAGIPEEEWPIWLAGAEYWLYRKEQNEEGDDHGPST